MPSILPTTKRDVLLRVRNKLQTIPKYRDRVFIVNGEQIDDNLRDAEFLTLSMAAGTFEFAVMVGGGSIPYQSTIRIGFHKMDARDRQGTDEVVTLDTDGIYNDELTVIQTLWNSFLDEGLCGETADKILIEPLMPLNDGELQRQNDEAFGGQGHFDSSRCVLHLDFGCKFHLATT